MGATIPKTVEKWTFEGAAAEIQYLNVAQLVHVGGQCKSCVATKRDFDALCFHLDNGKW